MMRRLLLPSLALLVASQLPLSAQVAGVTIVKGEVVDVACSVSKGAAGTGEDHAACAMTCAKNGEPMALLADDAVYVIEGSYAADKNAKLLDFVAKKIEAKGTITERDGRKYLNVAAMMVQKEQ